MRRAIATAALLSLAGCSTGEQHPHSANEQAWKPGHSVVVLVADVAPGHHVDASDLGRRPGVISVWGKGNTVRLSFGRKAQLVDLAALTLELERTPGFSNVRQVVVAPDRPT